MHEDYRIKSQIIIINSLSLQERRNYDSNTRFMNKILHINQNYIDYWVMYEHCDTTRGEHKRKYMYISNDVRNAPSVPT